MRLSYWAALCALVAAWTVATIDSSQARLQLSIGASGSTFTCFDGQLGCDQSGGVNNLLVVDTTIGGAFVQLTLTQSTFGKLNELQLSSSNIDNLTATPLTVTLLASDTNFVSPVSFVNNSGSLTFNSNVGAADSTLKFWADVTNTQGANPANTPGTLLETVSGHALTDPDSFAGSKIAAFDASAPFSMTEGAALVLRADGSVTGFNQSMQSGIPEPSTWVLFATGMGLLVWVGSLRSRPRNIMAA